MLTIAAQFPQNVSPWAQKVSPWEDPDDADFIFIGEYRIPVHTYESIKFYVEHRGPPGDFLYDVLTNNLSGAVGRADWLNRSRLADIVSVLYNYAPQVCWGSEDSVKRWLEKTS